MKYSFAAPLLVFFALGSTASSSAASSSAASSSTRVKSGPWVMGYYMGYLADRQPPSKIDWKGLTHLAVGFFVPRADGSLDAGLAPSTADRKLLVQAARQNKRVVLATLGGQDTGPMWYAATCCSENGSAARATFISSLKNLVKSEGYDGLDLDWEPLEPKDQPLLLELVKTLRKELPGTLLTFPADGADNLNFPANRTFYAQLAPLLDQLNLMTYGMGFAFEGWKTWHSSPLYGQTPNTPTSVDLTVQGYLKAGIPAAKIGIGIGFYGICYGAPAKGPLEDTVGTKAGGAKLLADDNDLSYANIVTQYAPLGTRKWDSSARVPYLSFAKPSGPKGCTYLSYEDEASILEKGKYLRQKGLGGVILWNVNQGYIPGRVPANPLLDATRRAFLVRR